MTPESGFPWVDALDPIAPLAVMDLRIDYLDADGLGAADVGLDGAHLAALPVAGGVVVGAGGLRGRVVPGAFKLQKRLQDGLVVETTTLRLALDDGASVLVELRGLGGSSAHRATLRVIASQGPHAWLGGALLVAAIRTEQLATPAADGTTTRDVLRVHAMEGRLPADVAPDFERLPELHDLPPLRTEHVLNIVGSCSEMEPFGPAAAASDGLRTELWPIVGGRFRNADGTLQGVVIPGGGDYPVTRQDGSEWIDALYRLRTDAGQVIVIHNKGFYRDDEFCRLQPEFIVGRGEHDWLQRSLFVASLTFPVPAAQACAASADHNDRLIQVHRIL